MRIRIIINKKGHIIMIFVAIAVAFLFLFEGSVILYGSESAHILLRYFMPILNCVYFTRNRGDITLAKNNQQSGKKSRNPFVTYCLTSVACILIVSVCFVFTMFSADGVNWVTQEQTNLVRDMELPMRVSTTVRELERKKETNLGSVSESEKGSDMKQGGGTVVETVNIGGVPIGLYGSLPWAASDSAFIFNAPVAQKDVIDWINQGGDSGIDSLRKGVFVYEHNAATWTTDDEGVTCLGFAPVPSIVDRNYCNGFTKTDWSSKSTSPTSAYGYADKGTPRKYCAILQRR